MQVRQLRACKPALLLDMGKGAVAQRSRFRARPSRPEGVEINLKLIDHAYEQRTLREGILLFEPHNCSTAAGNDQAMHHC